MLGNFFMCFVVCQFFSKSSFLKIISAIPSVSKSLDPDQARHFVGPDLGPNYLQRLSADLTSKQRVIVGVVFGKVNWKLLVIQKTRN